MAGVTSFLMLRVAALAALISQANMHMILLTPHPFDTVPPVSDPLSSTGSNFPCQNNGASNFYDSDGISNPMTVGEPQQLTFKGSATHDGGSCQVALTTDKAPTASSKWEVILSIEGGCPTTDDMPTGSVYNYTIPADFVPGDYVLAWTWISHTAGSGEYYMNCAPIQVRGGSGGSNATVQAGNHTHARKRADYPNLAVFNLASINSCKTSPGFDYVYEDPGPNVLRPGGASRNYATPTGTSCFPLANNAVASTSGTISSMNPGAYTPIVSSMASSLTSDAFASSAIGTLVATPTSSATADAGSTTSTTITFATGFIGITTSETAITDPAKSVQSISESTAIALSSQVMSRNAPPPGKHTTSLLSLVFPTITPIPQVAHSSHVPASHPAPAKPHPTTVASSLPAPKPQASSSPSSIAGTDGGNTAALTGVCTQEGMWNCIGGTSFQRCASGQWTAVQPMAAGTACTPGESETLWARSRFSRKWMLMHRGVV